MRLKLSHVKLITTLVVIIAMWFASCKPKVTQTWAFYDIRYEAMVRPGYELLNGNVKQIITKDPWWGPDNLNMRDFDGKGNLISSTIKYTEVITDNDTIKKHIIINTKSIVYKIGYNKDGNKATLISAEYYAGNDLQYPNLSHNFRLKNKFTFDSSGHPLVECEDCEYDASGNIIKWGYNFETTVGQEVYRCKYDNQHRIIESKMYEPSRFIIKETTRYIEHDSHNNWIKKVVYHQTYPPMRPSSRIDTVTRTITYY